MSAINALIVSSAKISKDEFIDFFESCNCVWYSGHKDEAILFDDFTQVGICLMNDNYIEMLDANELDFFRQALKDEPRSFFEVNRTKGDDPQNLYLRVAIIMSHSWPIAVQDLQDNILSVQQIRECIGS